MRKTFCDRCGGECRNFVATLGGDIEHTTSQGEYVGRDQILPKELCSGCLDVIRDSLGLLFVPSLGSDGLVTDSARQPAEARELAEIR